MKALDRLTPQNGLNTPVKERDRLEEPMKCDIAMLNIDLRIVRGG